MQRLTPFDISKDVWIIICGCLTPLDFLSLRQTCSFLRDTTNNRKHRSITKYWQQQCESFWYQIEKSHYKTKNWFCLFQSMIDIIILCDLIIMLKKHEKTIEQLQSTDSIIFSDNIADGHGNNIRYKNQNLQRLDAKLRLIYGLKITMNAVLDEENQRSASGVLENIMTRDKVELFKIYIYNRNVNKIIVYNYSHGNRMERSVLETAIFHSSFKILEYLLGDEIDEIDDDNHDHDHDIDVTQYLTIPPLQMATDYKQVNTVSLLVKHPSMTKQGINEVDMLGRTALHSACSLARFRDQSKDVQERAIKNGVEIIKILVNDKRTVVNMSDFNGNTPVMLAIRTHSKFVEALLTLD